MTERVEQHPLPYFDRVEQWEPDPLSYEAAIERITLEANIASTRYYWERSCVYSARMQSPLLKGDIPELNTHIKRIVNQYRGDDNNETI
tara:strand:- start:570 stop:836 length:267 start_codon:yes stop_codon:yes gene_type:complete